ncbi:MAG: type VI secretion system baseplate subunit TssF, partial [Myxococcales bacterium]|nr:type VI secretion system baseplate subunit TssF [Myxococcales bacterium]
DVERLIEAFAFLTARLRERLESGAPEVIDALCEALAPHLLRGMPATSIVEVQPRLQALRGAQRIPRGRVMEAPSDRGGTCTFRTAADLELLPVEVADVAVKARRGEGFELVIRLRVSEAGRALLGQPRALRLYLAGEPALARALRFALLDRCASISTCLLDQAGKVVSERALAPSAIRQVGLGDDEARLEWPALSPPGLRLLVEHLAAPELFHFVEIDGPLCAEGASGGEIVELRLVIAGGEALPGEVGPGSIRLHCVPVVNLFPATSEPIRLDARTIEHPLRVAGHRPGEVEVVAVTGVRSSRGGRAELREFRPLWGIGAPPPGSATYRLLRSVSPVDGCVDASLRLSAADDRPLADLDGEVVHVDLLCTNRLLAGELGPGAIHREPRSGGLRFRNITPVSPPARAPLGPELRWRLLGHLAMGHASLADAEALRAYDAWVAEQNRARFEGVVPPAPAAGEASYVGMDECESCHDEAMTFWRDTRHAGAFKTLHDDNKQYDLSCVGCHVTGFRKPGGSEVVENAHLQAVQCEQCHGPGSRHVEEPEVGGKANAIRREAPIEVCMECHTPEHSDTFDYNAYLRDIVGPGHGEGARLALGKGPTGRELRQAGFDKAGGACKKKM